MNDLLDGTFIDFDYQVAFISSSPYTPSDYNCQLLGFYDLTNCYLSSDKTKFYMNLYSNSTLSKNQYRDINPLPFFYLNKPFDKISVNVYIMLPQNMIPPNVILSYPSPYVNICEDTTIQIISEFVTGNNPLIIKKWNLESINPSNSANAITLTQLLSSSPNQKNLTLPKLSLNENTEYQFSIDIENFIGTQNKIFFNLKTLTQNTPFIKVIEPKQFKNMYFRYSFFQLYDNQSLLFNIRDFRNSFNFKISYNTSLCGSGSTPVQANKISIALQDGSNILYNQAQMTGLTSQDYDFSIPSQFLQSERYLLIIIFFLFP